MSGLCALLHPTGATVELELLRRLAKRAAYRGPDEICYWIDGHVGLVHLRLRATPESHREIQPRLSDDRRICVAADARIDNREELIGALSQGGPLRVRWPTDADLILAAWERWVEDCPRHLLGDFAFAVWDGRSRKLFAARDPLGVRPLCYARVGGGMLLASDEEQILQHPAMSRGMDETTAGAYLLAIPQEPGATFLRDIHSLPPGHSLLVEDGRLELRRYWRPPGAARLAIPAAERPREIAELLQRAVADRLRAAGDIVGLAPDGGADGRRLVEIAHRLAGDRGRPPAETLVCHWEGSGATVPSAVPGAVEMVRVDEPRLLVDSRAFQTTVALPYLGAETLERSLLARLRERGGRVLLTTQGAVPVSRSAWPQTLPPWIDRRFAERTGLEDHLRGIDRDAPAPRPNVYPRAVGLPCLDRALAWQERLAARLGVEVRHPYLERRLIEIVAVDPDEPGADRGRPAAATDVDGLIELSLRGAAGESAAELLRDPRLAAFGMIDGDRLRRAFAAYRAGRPSSLERHIWPVLTLELWLRQHWS